MRDLQSNIQMVFLGTVTVSGTTPAASSLVDMKGFNSCVLVAKTNTVTDAGTAEGFTLTAQLSDETGAGTFVDAVAADVTDLQTVSVTVTADTDDNKVAGKVGIRAGKRYARFNAVGTSGSNATVDVYAILGDADARPTTFIGTSVSAT